MNPYLSKKFKLIFGKLISGKRPIYYACFIAGICLGVLAKQKVPIRLKEELDLLPILQILVTLIIALLITHYGKQQVDDQRAEKVIIIEQLRECQTKAKDIFRDFRQCCEQNAISQTEAVKFNQAMRDFSNQLDTIKRTIGYFGTHTEINKQWDVLWQNYISFKAVVTDLPPFIQLANNKVLHDAENQWRSLNHDLIGFIFTVNRL